CVGGDPVVCQATDQCHVAGVCDPATGACSAPPAAAGTPCQDTDSDVCTRAACDGAGVCEQGYVTSNEFFGCTVLQDGSPTAGKYKVSVTGSPGEVRGNLCIGRGTRLEASGTTVVTGSILLDPGQPPATCKSTDPGINCARAVVRDLSAEIDDCQQT